METNLPGVSAPSRREFVHATLVGATVLFQGCAENAAEQEDDRRAYVMVQNLEAKRLDAEIVVRDGSDEQLYEETLTIDPRRSRGTTGTFPSRARVVEYRITEDRGGRTTTDAVELPSDPGERLPNYEDEQIRFHYTSDGGLEYVPIEVEDDEA